MGKTYRRPLGLVYGPDAERLIEGGRGGALGGNRSIAFTLIEQIERGGRREIAPYAERIGAIEAERGGVWRWPQIMGIVNVTPDSFSDGGKLAGAEAAITFGVTLAGEGAGILDIGGESTRPGSDGVSLDEELARTVPVIRALAAKGHRVSIDTRKASVMRQAKAAGASLINDVSALRHDRESLRTVAELGLPVVLMHAQGDPRTMQLDPRYDDVVLDVYDFLEERISDCLAAGIPQERIAVDPGIGFGKTFRHNLDILSNLTLYHGLGVAVLVGLSRKAFIGALTGVATAALRVNGSVGGAVHAVLQGTHVVRVHDVKATKDAIEVALAAHDPARSGL
jgi:dihydropteroate synthase